METNIHTPRQLFQQPVCYEIPLFQRPYVWSQEDQWEPLWDDVRNVAEDYLEKMVLSGGDDVLAQRQTTSHFLGAVVLKQVSTPAKFIPKREVIDGQQRMTTIQLLLDAIQLVCEEFGAKAAMRLSMLVLNPEELIGDDDDEIFKLRPSRTDQDAFKHAMDNGLAVNRFEESLIVQAHEFFQRQVREWIEKPLGTRSDRVEALEAAVTTMLQMVVIDLGPQDDPNVIFETLNARGTPLEQSDLIKNFVMSKFPKSGVRDVWEGLDDKWWREEVAQGKLYRPRLDMLLNYWLAMRTGQDVGPSRVFDVFRSFTSERSISDVMSDLKRDLRHYRRFMTRRTPEEEVFYYRTFQVMKAGVITPVLLLLLAAERGARIRAFRALESFLVRRMICRQTTKDYNRLFLELASRLRESRSDNADKVVAHFLKEQTWDRIGDSGNDSVDKVVAAFLKKQTAYSREWPNDITVAVSLETSPLYRLLTRGRLRLVLEGIESKLRTPKSEPLVIPTKLTIEHLMPVSWEAHWPLPEGDDPVASAENRHRIVHTIGNLTLVTRKLNSAMSNAPWDEKRAELSKFSKMSLSDVLTMESQWNEEKILARSRHMARLISQCWPGPDSDEWGS
ncbi:MAG: DUF262 domain-containing protein [Caldilineaceae bacterium]|nr:DUF262 domain-containing protein [Caldilineaceae bacterium]